MNIFKHKVYRFKNLKKSFFFLKRLWLFIFVIIYDVSYLMMIPKEY